MNTNTHIERIGLLAGSGEYPIMFAKAARRHNCKIVAIAINGHTQKELASCVDKIYWVDMDQLKKAFEILLLEGLKNVIFAGRIPKSIIFRDEFKIDKEVKSILGGSKDRLTSSLLNEVINRLSLMGITLVNSTTFLEDCLVKEGPLTAALPDEATWEDIRFGQKVAMELARLDIGQTVVVKNKDIIAVEGIEGTDQTIRRGGSLVGAGTVVIKVARPNQDMRFDLPIIGPETVSVLREIKAKAMAVEAKKTLAIDKDKLIELADEFKIAIVGI